MKKTETDMILNNPNFILLTAKRRKSKMVMVILTMSVFLMIQILWAFYPEIVNTRVVQGSSISIAIGLTVLMVLTAVLLAGYYALVSGKELDTLNKKLISELTHE